MQPSHIHNLALFQTLAYLELKAYSKPCHRAFYPSIIQPCLGISRTLCNASICRNLAYSESWNIHSLFITASRRIRVSEALEFQKGDFDNPEIVRTLTFSKLDMYSEFYQRFKMKYFAIRVKSYNYFPKTLYFRYLAGIRPSLSKYSLSWGVTQHNALYEKTCRALSIIVNSDIFRHTQVLFRRIQPYCGIFRILCSSCIFRTLPYLESWHS